MSKSVILNQGILKYDIRTYSSGGYTFLIRNNKSGDMENIPFSSVSPDLAGYPTLEGTQTFTGLNTFNNSVTFANGISIVGGSYAVAATAPTLTASRSIVYPDASGTIALTSDLTAYVPKTRNITINGTTYDLSADRTWTIVSMIYPSAGIAVSTGTAWGTSITDNSTNWNTAYTNRITSLTTTGSSGAATLTSNTLNIPNYTLSGLGGEPAITAGTTAQYWRGDKSWQTLPIYTLSGLGGQPQLNGTGFVKASGTTISYDNSTYLTTSGTAANSSQLDGRTVGTSTNNIPYLSATRNLIINNPESYSGEVRLGAAWDRGGVYASSTLSLGTSSSEIHFVFSNATKAYFNSSGNLFMGQGTGASSIYMGDSDEGQRELHCNSNRIGFLTQAGGWGAYCDDSGNWTAVGDITAYSDIRVKENIKTIENALDKVLGLRGVSYTRINSSDNKTKIGVIAQETLAVVPEVVNRDDEGMYSVSYGSFGGLFIEAFKEHNKIINAQQEKIDDLYRQIQFLVENR